MQIIDTELAGVKILQPTIHGDKRGYLFESFRDDEFRAKVKDISFTREYQYAIDTTSGYFYGTEGTTSDYLISVVMGRVRVGMRNADGENQVITITSGEHTQLFIPSGIEFSIDAETPAIIQIRESNS